MPSDSGFLVEEFINAITAQLDRAQDALRLKAVNRPLTYALKDLSLELQVFVELDPRGNVRFRTSMPNETGASSVKIAFTTITRPMIEENTVSLAVSRSPSLSELGLDPTETHALEQVGVRNAAQLQQLGSRTGTGAVARVSGVSIERLRAALQLGRPQVHQVGAEPIPDRPPEAPPTLPRPPREPVPPPVSQPPGIRQEIVSGRPRGIDFEPRLEMGPHRRLDMGPQLVPPRPVPGPADPPPASPVVTVSPDARRLHMAGVNLLTGDELPVVRLNNRPLLVAQADDDRLVVELGGQPEPGALEIQTGDGEVLSFELRVDSRPDPWAPNGQPT